MGWPTMLAFASGAMSRTLKARVIGVFLLIYYNQVIGLSPTLVSTLIFVTVIFDAVIDPIIGQISDNFRSRLGRRHPFMYAAVIPTPLLFFALWNPPLGQSDTVVATYMFAVLITLRLFDTFFELPSAALLPELVQDYDKRTIWVTARGAFGHLASVGMILLAYNVFLKERPDGTGGVLDREGYFYLSIFGACIMFTVMALSALSTHRQIPWLAEARVKIPSFRQMLPELGATLSNTSFIALLGYVMTIAVAQGMKTALDVYWYLYGFGLKQSQIGLIATMTMFGTLLGILCTTWIIQWLGKKAALMWAIALAFFFASLPSTLWILGLTPPLGSDLMVAFLSADQAAQQGLWVVISVASAALLADVVEDVEVKTGLRSEGVLMAVEGLMQKGVGGVGALAAGLILAFASFPVGAGRDSVPRETMEMLAMAFLSTLVIMYGAAFFATSFYRITRAKHEENLAIIRARSGLVGGDR